MASDIAERFAKLSVEGMAIRHKREIEELWAAERERVRAMFAHLSLDDVRALWDQYDGCNEPSGFEGEDIHAELNRRGDGEYCAV